MRNTTATLWQEYAPPKRQHRDGSFQTGAPHAGSDDPDIYLGLTPREIGFRSTQGLLRVTAGRGY